MHVPQRILAPVDLSPTAEQGFEYAAGLALALDAVLVAMVNVNLPERAALEELAEHDDIDIESLAHRSLMSLAERLAPQVRTETAITFADFPGDGILRAARDRTADLIVVCSHGRTGLRRVLLGSVAEKVSRHAIVPVVVVPAAVRVSEESA